LVQGGVVTGLGGGGCPPLLPLADGRIDPATDPMGFSASVGFVLVVLWLGR